MRQAGIGGGFITPPQWDDIVVHLTRAQRTGASVKPDWGTVIAGQPFQGWLVDDTADDEYLHFTIEVHHGHKTGTVLKPHVHWTPIANGVGTCIWQLDYSIVDIGGSWGGALTASGTETLSAGAQGKHLWTTLTDVVMTGITGVSSVMMCRLWRQGSVDSLVGDVSPIHVGFHMQWDQFGSRTETTK